MELTLILSPEVKWISFNAGREDFNWYQSILTVERVNGLDKYHSELAEKTF